MIFRITSLCLAVAAGALANTYPVIVRGTVTMDDGTPPPVSVGIERICSDTQSSAPGPITNKKGEWIWRIELDPLSPNACFFRASHTGYTSTTIDASHLNLTSRDTTITVPPIVVSTSADPYAIRTNEDKLPSRAKAPFKKAMKDLDSNNLAEAAQLMQEALAAAPKFASGWHALGLIDEKLGKDMDARDAYTKAIEADPKLFTPYVTLARLCVKAKDWQCAEKTSENLLKADSKHTYPEIYIHLAVAQYELKDFAGAEQSAAEAIRRDPKNRRPREEYIDGRILEAKGDLNGAREHMSKYLELDPNAPDAAVIRVHLMDLGKPDSEKLGATEPELELP